MPIATPTLSKVLDEAVKDYVASNPNSKAINDAASGSLPGGTTRNVVHMKPFPVVLAEGDGSYLTDVDGHRYLDLCAEYSACLFGHSHPVIRRAIHDAVEQGFALGGVNRYEGRLAKLFCDRFKTMDKVRFSNSGTETNMTALALTKAYTGRSKIIVFEGGYHGGLATFTSQSSMNMKSTGKKTMNAPHDWVVVPYNDIPALEASVSEHKADLACIFLELMQGSSGCTPADVDFVKACRSLSTDAEAVLFFDEVMTSRMSIHGYQDVLGNFGAFGGKAGIMDMLEPGYVGDGGGGVYHSGTFNNNVTTMVTATAVLEEIWTREEAQGLFEKGVELRQKLNDLATRHRSRMYVTGTGSLMAIHFKETETETDVIGCEVSTQDLKELFFFDMLKKGVFLARRLMISLMTITSKEKLETFVDAVEEFLRERAEFVRLN